MSAPVVSVGYQYVYDLYYRTRHAILKNEVYQLDFLDWVRAGIAFNVLGRSEPGRKVSYFCSIYDALEQGITARNVGVIRRGVSAYYEDMFKLYQNHLTAQLKNSRDKKSGGSLEPKNLVLLPSFAGAPGIKEVLPEQEVFIQDYRCKHLAKLRDVIATVYASEDSLLFRCISLYYDLANMQHNEVVRVGVIL